MLDILLFGTVVPEIDPASAAAALTVSGRSRVHDSGQVRVVNT